MRKQVFAGRGSLLSRIAAVSLLGGLVAACSSNTARFSEDPFSNPFSGGSGNSHSAAAPAAPQQGYAPVSQSSGYAPAPSYSAQPYQPVASVGGGGWSAQGGTSITVGQGDTLTSISNRYGVPANAILSANGLSSASQVAVGRNVVIPVYSASAASSVAKVTSTPVSVMAPARPAVNAVNVAAKAPVNTLNNAKQIADAKVAATQKNAQAVLRQPVPTPVVNAKAQVVNAKTQVADAKMQAVNTKTQVADAKAQAINAKTQQIANAKSQVVNAKTQQVASAKTQVEQVRTTASQKLQPPVQASVIEPVRTASAAPAQAASAHRDADQTASLQSGSQASSEFRWPARGRVITGFGTNGGNAGINIAVPEGTAVRATESGTVTFAGDDVKSYGNLVLIKHDNGYVSAYAHNGSLNVKRGERVSRGQVIAKSGQSGDVTSPQLHFEIRKGQTPVDPIPYLGG